MADTRTPRDLTTRDKTARVVYAPPSTLPTPNPEPGMTFRWVATHQLGQATHTNVSKRLREGWVPVKAEDHPELMVAGNASGNVEIGGLMLCKMPTERVEARTEFYNRTAQDQMASVDNSFMRESDPRMPLFRERNSTSTKGARFGTGS